MDASAPLRKLQFTQDMENKAIKIIFTDAGFVNSWSGRLKEEHFSYTWNKTLFRVVRDFREANKKLPSRDIIEQESQKYISPDDNAEAFYQHFVRILDAPLDEADYIKKELMDHMKRVDYDAFVLKFAEMCREGKHEGILPQFTEMTRKHSLVDPQPRYMESGNSVAERVKKELEYRASVPSPWPTFNANNGGGFQSGTVTCFMGPTGSGKSILLANVGAHALRNKRTVYHFTFELSREKTSARYDVILSGASYKERAAAPDKVDESIGKMNLGALYIIEYPTDTCSANKVRATIDEYVSRGCPPPDIVILDYLTIMNPSDTGVVDMTNEYAKLKQIAEDARGFAMDPAYGKPPIVSALQSNRGAELKTAAGNEIKKGDIADSYAVMGVIDGNLTINQSSTEKQSGKMRLFSAKARDNVDGYTITCDIKYENLRVEEDVETTARYQAAAEGKKIEAMKHGQIPPALDPSSLEASMDQMCNIGLRKSKTMVVNATIQDKWKVESLVAKPPTPPALPSAPEGLPPAVSA